MDSLFDITIKGEIVISPEVLFIEEFEQLWERDENEGKKQAKKEIMFVWGMTSDSDKNIYRDFKEPAKRAGIIKSDLFGKDSQWKPDMMVSSAIIKYRDRIPKSVLDDLLGSVEDVFVKLTGYLTSVDFAERDGQGKMVHDVKKVRDIISTMGKTVTDYNDLKRQIAAGKALKDEAIRGGGSKGYFESSDMLNDFK